MTYRTRYGYPWRWAVLAELAWRVEHSPFGERTQTFGYRWRKRFERRGSPLL